jgi:hypothetical protein
VFLAIGDRATGSGCYLVYNQPRHALAIATVLERDQAKVARAIVGEVDVLRGEHCRVNPRTIGVAAAGVSITLTVPSPSMRRWDARGSRAERSHRLRSSCRGVDASFLPLFRLRW